MHGRRIDQVLAAQIDAFSRSHLQRLIADGHVRVGGRPVQVPSRRVAIGQVVDVELVPTAESRAFKPQDLPINVVHEDAHLLVLDKAPGMVVHPAAGNWSGTLLNALLARYPASAALPRAGIVHRLDKDTSGLMVVAKTLEAATALTRLIAARQVRRQYLALCWGAVQPLPFRIDAPIGRDAQSRIRMAVVTGGSGRPAQTDVKCLAAEGDWSAVECTLHTGRTHQIRVHLAARGHPLVADTLYGGKSALGMQRQALHARHLSFVHPASGEIVAFHAPVPADMSAAWAQLFPGSSPA